MDLSNQMYHKVIFRTPSKFQHQYDEEYIVIFYAKWFVFYAYDLYNLQQINYRALTTLSYIISIHKSNC